MAGFRNLPPDDERKRGADNLRNIATSLIEAANLLENADNLEDFRRGVQIAKQVGEYFFNAILESMAAQGRAQGASGMVIEIGPDVDGPKVGGLDIMQMMDDLLNPSKRPRTDPGSLN